MNMQKATEETQSSFSIDRHLVLCLEFTHQPNSSKLSDVGGVIEHL
jgi:hypothetical protein